MVAYKNVILLAVGAAAIILPRDSTTLQKDLSSINSKLTALHGVIDGYSGGLLTALPIQAANNDLSAALNSAATDAKSSSVVSDDEAADMIDYISENVEPNIKDTIEALVAKKSQFQVDHLDSIVKNNLIALKKTTDTFGAALLAKTPSGKTEAGKAALAGIDKVSDSGIAAFS